MEEQRILEIKSHLMNYGTTPGERYTNQEIVDRLVSLQEAMANEVFSLNHAEHFAARDIMLHFGALSAEYGLQKSNEYRRLSMNMRSLGCTIACLKKGFAGERRTKEALRIMAFDPNVQILYNLTLEDDAYCETPRLEHHLVRSETRRIWPQVLSKTAMLVGGIIVGRKLLD